MLTLPDGKKLEGSSEVNAKMQEILSLDYKQFKQLSMLAQGEFAKLLTASPSEKSKIFREIFDTELYEKIAANLRKRSAALYKQVAEYRHKMEEDVELFSPTGELLTKWQLLLSGESYYYDGILSFLKENAKEYEKQLSEWKKKEQKAQREIEHITGRISEGEQTAHLLKKQEAEKKRKEALLLEKEENDRERNRLFLAEAAKEVRILEEKAKELAERYRQQKEKKESLRAEIKGLQERKQKEQTFIGQRERLEEAYARLPAQEELKGQLVNEKTGQEKEKQALFKLQQEYLAAEEKEQQAQLLFEQADRSYRHGMAGILAEELSEGMPCPVCGSFHHPLKAEKDEGMPTEKAVEEKKRVYEAMREERVTLHGRTTACRERGELIQKRVQELTEALWVLKEKEEQDTPFVKAYLESHTRQEFLAQIKAYETLLTTLSEKEKVLEERKQEEQSLLHSEKEARSAYESERKKRGFSGEEAYRSAFLPEAERNLLLKKTEGYDRECHANEQLLLHLEQELSGRQPENIPALKGQLEAKRKEREDIGETLSSVEHQWKDMVRLFASLSEKQEKVKRLSRQYGIVKGLDDAANGNNRLRLVLEQYVLAAYFEEILKAANVRLKLMSSGRYELWRAQTVGDGRTRDSLEMEVLDYYTGKHRSVKTLSGGESFKVSLSLALGMSDVVQAYSGGIRVETLFIDEGFGALDSESLEQACLTLKSLVEKDRLIGIISHVPELAEKIENQIKIQKTNAGSTIEVMVC